MKQPLLNDAALSTGGVARSHPHHVPIVRLGRRGVLLGAGAAVAGAALMGPASASADGGDLLNPKPLAQPSPIPGGVEIAPGVTIHVFAPGPTSITLPLSQLTLQGLDFDPSVITDYSGFTALAYPVGTARGSDGTTYQLEGDMRVYSGKYLPKGADIGQAREATWGFV